ncbi:invasion associated locus B family protein [Phreatobacter sp. AB_2022a]|uniref:invasion associated locus B family protein n=1 Tax=Phreatobacter sp. AB_2022a TaxID=3003134 RepID=UPI0022871EE3|nr:invasion associated locus B family protein [Phreatobacter sp. AB_2022a]MCZ0735092.1 invasion associated locus B family protein [Phreatobacter sp. AB_2022a]
MLGLRHLPLLAIVPALGAATAFGQPASPPIYSVRRSEVAVPANVPLGQYRRVIRPFKNWTLICDENLRARRRVCNITQAIVDQAGAVAFSWSLAGSDSGAPVFILRAPAAVGADRPITLAFGDGSAPILVKTNGCDASVCVAIQHVGPRLRGYIAKGVVVQISFSVTPAGASGAPTLTGLYAPLEGLSKAIEAI